MPVIVLVCLFVPKWREGLPQKYGFLDSEVFEAQARETIWVHAVSYGEVKTVAPFINELKKSFSNHKVFFSTGTLTGQKLAKELFKENAFVFYCPFDFYFAVKNWFDLIRPKFMIFVETEIWPEILFQAAERKISAFIINGRLTDRSVARYKLVKPLFGEILSCFKKIYTQSQLDKERFLQIAAKPEQLTVLPNLKFDSMQKISEQLQSDLKRQLNIKEDTFVVVAGSTHRGEEELALEVFQSLISKYPKKDLRLILAPRHLERLNEVENFISKLSLPYLKMSSENTLNSFSSGQVLLVDLMGKLGALYSVANVALLGGTWAKVGGHNPLEPAAYAIPVLVGPHTYKITDLATALSESNIMQVKITAEEIIEIISGLIEQGCISPLGEITQQVTVSSRLVQAIKETYCFSSGFISVPSK